MAGIAGLSAGLLLLGGKLPWWLVLAGVAALLAVAGWQRRWVRGQLAGEPVTPSGTACPLLALAAGGPVSTGVVAGSQPGGWWVWNHPYPTYQFKGIDQDTGKIEYEASGTARLPASYALKTLLWELGWKPLPDRVTVPAGRFRMGSDTGRDNEEPVHEVQIPDPFTLSRHEITFEQYDYYVWWMQQAGVAVEFRQDEGWGRAERPVINVSWEDASNYAYWLAQQTGEDCRLPTEAEWEYAARAGTETAYFWGDEIGRNKANCDGCGSQWDNKQTAPVGSFAANAFGLQDMHGNVWEWVQDCYATGYQGTPVDGAAYETTDCAGRVLRGGSWGNTPDNLRSALRYDSLPDSRNSYVGFRVVCSSPSER
ncbi:MAG: formylglycine-generating enzyme family protein [Thiolinea sp.]